MKIFLNEKYRLTHDGYNWRIEKFRESFILDKGKYKGSQVDSGWVLLEKFWPHPDQAVRFVIKEMINDSEDVLNLSEFEIWYETTVKNMEENFREFIIESDCNDFDNETYDSGELECSERRFPFKVVR